MLPNHAMPDTPKSEVCPCGITNHDSPAQNFVRYALGIGAIELIPEGRTLKNGRLSPYFFNSGLFRTGRAIAELAQSYVAAYNIARPDVLFGPAYKGIPLVAAIATMLGNDVEYSFNRKEEKDHGEGGTLVGAPLAGKRVLIVDDVVTNGKTKREAVDFIKQHGGIPIGLAIAFDRQEYGFDIHFSATQQFEKEYGIPVYASATLTDLISVLKRIPPESGDDEIGETLEKILAYQKQYGIAQTQDM